MDERAEVALVCKDVCDVDDTRLSGGWDMGAR